MATCKTDFLCTLDVALFTTYIKSVFQQIRLLSGLTVVGKMRSITFKLILLQCCKTSALFVAYSTHSFNNTIKIFSLDDTKLNKLIGNNSNKKLKEEIELVHGIYEEFDEELFLEGNLQPVFFGSALYNFGIKELLDCFIEIAPSPLPKTTDRRLVKPDEDKFSGFVFKIHANMDPKHRDRLAFVKIVSGIFKRNTPYLHVRHNKKIKFSSPNTFFAEKKKDCRFFISW